MTIEEEIPTIDWEFLKIREGGQATKGYVPQSDGRPIGRSGVTIATGFDLGQRNQEDLLRLGIPPELIKKLYPYLGLKGNAALDILSRMPLTITKEDASIIDENEKCRTVYRLAYYWKKLSGSSFRSLPPQVQTVLISLAWNFGVGLHSSIPRTFNVFINCSKSGKWDDLYAALENFPSRNPELRKRRLAEAALLKTLLVA